MYIYTRYGDADDKQGIVRCLKWLNLVIVQGKSC